MLPVAFAFLRPAPGAQTRGTQVSGRLQQLASRIGVFGPHAPPDHSELHPGFCGQRQRLAGVLEQDQRLIGRVLGQGLVRLINHNPR